MIGQQNANMPLDWNHFSHRSMFALFILLRKKTKTKLAFQIDVDNSIDV